MIHIYDLSDTRLPVLRCLATSSGWLQLGGELPLVLLVTTVNSVFEDPLTYKPQSKAKKRRNLAKPRDTT